MHMNRYFLLVAALLKHKGLIYCFVDDGFNRVNYLESFDPIGWMPKPESNLILVSQ